MKKSSLLQPSNTTVRNTDLSIVIPAYREAKRIGGTLDELADFLKSDEMLSKLIIEVLVVVADAPDDTVGVALSRQKKFKDFSVLQPGQKVGKGRDVQYGMLRAKGDAVVFMDADLATPLRHLPKFYKAYLRGFEVIIAARNLRRHHPSVARRLLSNAGNMLFRIAGGVWLEDSQCGFKMFTRDAAQLCFSKLSILGWGFDMEVLAIAKTNKLKIRSYRVNDWRSVPEGTFMDGAIKNALNSLMELGTIAVRRAMGAYKR